MELLNPGRRKIPAAPLMGFPGIQLTGTTIRDNLEDAQTQFKSLALLYERYRPDIMFPMMDLSVEAEVLGCKILKAENSSYTVIDHPLKDYDYFKEQPKPEPYESGRMPVMLEVISLMSKRLDCLTAAYVTGPFTLAALLNGASQTIKNVIKDPEFLARTLEFVTEVMTGYVRTLVNEGADGICILEPTATGLSPGHFWEFSGRYIKQLTEECDIPVILHICGDASVLVPNMVLTGCKGLSLDSMVDISEVIREVPADVAVLGNIDPVNVVAYGSRKEIEGSVKTLLNDMKGYPNFILSTGCDLPPDTDLENIQSFMKFCGRHSTERANQNI